MSNVTAALECPGCEEILEAEERPNINWKLGTTRIVLVPTAEAIAHVYECDGLHDKFSAVLAAIGITDLDDWQKRLLVAPSISIAATIATPRGIEVEGEVEFSDERANPSLKGATPDLVIIDETIEGDEPLPTGTDVVNLDEPGSFKVTLPATTDATSSEESTEEKSAPEPTEKPAAKKRSTK